MHDDCRVVTTLVGDLADMAWAGHLLEVGDYMEVLSAILMLVDSWAYMKVALVVQVLLPAVARWVRKWKEVLATFVIVEEGRGHHACQLVTEVEKVDLVIEGHSLVSAYTSFQVLVRQKAAWDGVGHLAQH